MSKGELYRVEVSITDKNNNKLELEELIVSIFMDEVINSYNQSIEQEKQIRQDQRYGY